jgi:hypothetical protein
MMTEVSARPSAMVQALIDNRVGVPPERRGVDRRPGSNQGGNIGFRDVLAASPLEWAQLGNRLAMSGDDEDRPSLDRGEHLRILIAQLSLRNRSAHVRTVAKCATICYSSL